MTFRVENGGFSYGRSQEVLKDISFFVEQGETLAILGSNGVGKTTLIKCMLGFLRWTSGRSTFDGVDIRDMKTSEMWKRIGYVPQAKQTVFPCSVLEMVVMGRSAHLNVFESPGKKDEEIAMEALATVGAEHLKNRICNQISGGELQLVLIARALASEPELLILDEPESNLDLKNQVKVINTIERICSDNHISFIINTHYPEHAMHISHKTMLLGGEYRMFGRSEDVITEENMKRVFGIQVYINEFSREGKRYQAVVPMY